MYNFYTNAFHWHLNQAFHERFQWCALFLCLWKFPCNDRTTTTDNSVFFIKHFYITAFHLVQLKNLVKISLFIVFDWYSLPHVFAPFWKIARSWNLMKNPSSGRGNSNNYLLRLQNRSKQMSRQCVFRRLADLTPDDENWHIAANWQTVNFCIYISVLLFMHNLLSTSNAWSIACTADKIYFLPRRPVQKHNVQSNVFRTLKTKWKNLNVTRRISVIVFDSTCQLRWECC